MLQPGTTIWYRHVEAVSTVKERPAVVLRVVGDTMLLVVGQTAEPQGANVLVGDRTACLKYATYFDCRTVIAAPVDRVERRLGRISPAKFREIEQACGEGLERTMQRARAEAELQRAKIAAAIHQHAVMSGCSLEEIADQARIARLHLRDVVSGSASWTREELTRIARVLGVDAAMLTVNDGTPNSDA